MDAIYALGRRTNEYETICIDGVNKLREYIKEEAVKEPLWHIVIDDLCSSEINELIKNSNFIQEKELQENGTNYRMQGSTFMFALLLNEYKIALEMLKNMPQVTFTGLGTIEWGRNPDYGFGIVHIDSYARDISCFLYHLESLEQKELREAILQRLEAEADDKLTFSIKNVPSCSSREMLRQFCEDKNRYPKIFRGFKYVRVEDLDSMLFFLKAFSQNEEAYQKILKGDELDILTEDSTGEDIDKTEKSLEKLIRLWKKSSFQEEPDIYLLYYRILLWAISDFRIFRLRNDSQLSYEKLSQLENTLWAELQKAPFTELDFKRLVDMNRDEIQLEILFEFAYKRLNRKMTLQVELNFEQAIRLEEIFSHHSRTINNFHSSNTAEYPMRLLRLLEYVGNIEIIDEGDVVSDSVAANGITILLKRYAGELKESFPMLLRCGLIPKGSWGLVYHKLKKKKRCQYMLPLLIVGAHGGFQENEN